jgi:hypothetical protein
MNVAILVLVSVVAVFAQLFPPQTTASDSILSCLSNSTTTVFQQCESNCKLQADMKDCDLLKCRAFCGKRNLPTQCFDVVRGVCALSKGAMNFIKTSCDVDCDPAAQLSPLLVLVLAIGALTATVSL